MINKCCDSLLHRLVFFHDAIGPCCSVTIIDNPLKMPFNSLTDEVLEEYLKIRKANIDIFDKGEGAPCYKGCSLYKESSISEEEPICINYITISNRTKCNCNCVYCEHTHGGASEVRAEMNRQETYDIVPILEKLKEKSLIAEGCEFIISGGECAEYPQKELEYLLNYVTHFKGSVILLSSGIKYSKSIESILKSGHARLTISVDSGTKKTYEKIKRVKAYNKVWDNLKKYAKAAAKNEKAIVEAKYIIIPGVNDSIEEIKAFFDKCKSIKCKYVRAEIEHYWMYDNIDKPLPDNIKEAFRYFESTANKQNLRFEFEGVGQQWLLERLGGNS